MARTRKKLSQVLFKQAMVNAVLPEQPTIAIDFSKVTGRIKNDDIFDFCRHAFQKPFHFDQGKGDPFKVSRWSIIVDAPSDPYEGETIFGTDDANYWKPELLIDAVDLLSNEVGLQAKDTLKLEKHLGLTQSMKFTTRKMKGVV